MTQEKNSPTSISKKYFTLLVGINDYPSPISTLYGCLKDLDQVEGYLRTQIAKEAEVSTSQTSSGLPFRKYDNLHICRLENDQATYRNIIKGFREFLCNAGPGDVVWFHFSGHGSEQFTAEEFIALEPNGKDQTIVCYQATEEDNLHLADKELAFLLHEVENANKENQSQESPHIIVTLDCCHSGSGTRDFEINPDMKSRKADLNTGITRSEAAKKKQGIRLLSSYVGDYEAQWKSKNQLEIPLAKHVLLSACESVQLAGDLPSGGVFISGLISALKHAGGQLNYSDLFIRTRIAVEKIRKQDQTPQFETLGEFDPYTRFLDGSALGNPKSYEVVHQGDHWFVNCGAIHGIPLSSRKATQVEILTAAPENTPVGKAELIGIEAQRSVLNLSEGTGLDKEKQYQAIVKFLPVPPVLVWVHGEENGVAAIRQVWDESRNIKMVESLEAYGEAQLEVEATSNRYRISDRRTGKLAIESPVDEDDSNLIVIDILEKMVNWERTISLQNEKSAIKDWFNLEIDMAKVPDLRPVFMTIKNPETIIKVDAANFYEKDGALIAAFIPYIRSNMKPAQKLYFYFLHLRSNYAITSYEGEFVYRPEEFKYNHNLEIPLLKKIKAWGLAADEQETTSYFKLFATTEALDYQQLTQSGIEGKHRGMVLRSDLFSIKNDWFCVTLKVMLERS